MEPINIIKLSDNNRYENKHFPHDNFLIHMIRTCRFDDKENTVAMNLWMACCHEYVERRCISNLKRDLLNAF